MSTPIALFALLFAAGVASATGLPSPEQLPTVELISSGGDGITLDITYPEAELKAADPADDNLVAVVHIPGAVPDFDAAGLALPELTRLIAVPDGYRVEARIISQSDRRYALADVVDRDRLDGRALRSVADRPAVEVGRAGWMRYLHVAPVVIRPARYDAGEQSVFAAERMEIRFDFIPDGSPSGYKPDTERLWSAAFEELFGAMLLNPSQLPMIPTGGRPVVRGSYVIITDSALARRTNEFANWKRQKGFDVKVVPIYQLGITQTANIKAYLQNAYNHWARPPEFVLLLGDVNMPGIQIPTYYIKNPSNPDENNDPTDQPYTYLAGNDYFPDVFIGRISCDSPGPSDAQKALKRVVQHERDLMHLHGLDLDAFHRATLWAGNFGQGNRIVKSPVENCRWLGERLREKGFDVEEFYWRQVGDSISPDPIVNSINRQVNIVAYRGWGDGNGTKYPQFLKPDLDRLDNGPLLPVFTIFVCNTGRFNDDQVNPVFGEYSYTRGEVNDARAALAFYGPSDLHTETPYNNTMLAGYYNALLYSDLRTLGPLTLRAKMEVWNQFPFTRAVGAGDYQVQFYFSVYNVLGDPEVNLYLDAPGVLSAAHPETLYVGDTQVPVTVTDDHGAPVRGALVTLLKGTDLAVSALTDDDGLAIMPVKLDTAGVMTVTAIAHQEAPYLGDILVTTAQQRLGFASVAVSNEQGDNRLLMGSPVNLRVTVRNTGTSAARGVTATLASDLEWVSVTDDHASFGDISAGGSAAASDNFTVNINSSLGYKVSVPFNLDIADADGHHYAAAFRLETARGFLALADYALTGGVVNSGETADVILTVHNHGNAALQGVYANLTSFDNAVTFPDERMTFGDIALDGVADCASDKASLTIAPEVREGRQIALRALFYDSGDGYLGTLPFTIVVGTPGINDPVGPDGYGYYIYENVDDHDAYPDAPDYNWIELDPDHGGAGANVDSIYDDSNVILPLPFTFRYYGQDCNWVTACDNGWLALDSTWYLDFSNWAIPSPQGPHNLVAPFWDDITVPDPNHPGDSGHRLPVKLFTRYDSAEGRFILEWSRVICRPDLDHNVYHWNTFEVILFDQSKHPTFSGDGEIVFQYLEVGNIDQESNFASVGIEDWDHANGLQVTYASHYPVGIDTLRAERAIKFTTNPPDQYLGVDPMPSAPASFALDEPRPNPFNAATAIGFSLPSSGKATVSLWDLSGRFVRAIAAGDYGAGRHQVTLNTGTLPAGVYIVRLEAGNLRAERKAVVIK